MGTSITKKNDAAFKENYEKADINLNNKGINDA